MARAIAAFMSREHRRIEELFARATAVPGKLDVESYEDFRSVLLRHMAMEERVLSPETQRFSRDPIPELKRMRTDHGKIAVLLAATPTPEVLDQLRTILTEHDRFEEEPGGLYEICERMLGSDLERVFDLMLEVPPVRVRPLAFLEPLGPRPFHARAL